MKKIKKVYVDTRYKTSSSKSNNDFKIELNEALDGEGMRQMERQQELASKEAYKEHGLKQTAINTGGNLSDLRQSAHTETHNERVTIMLRPTNLDQASRPEPQLT